ncbi:hypothetical protein BT69DRAFT_1281376 [Atractiella rhizophila]|nr:hypothetical protein BT69DRAFT_1281376 [Atractiella rhizophila]
MPVCGGLIITHETILVWANLRLADHPEEAPAGPWRHPFWYLNLPRNDLPSMHVRLLILPCPPDRPLEQNTYCLWKLALPGFHKQVVCCNRIRSK